MPFAPVAADVEFVYRHQGVNKHTGTVDHTLVLKCQGLQKAKELDLDPIQTPRLKIALLIQRGRSWMLDGASTSLIFQRKVPSSIDITTLQTQHH